MTDVIRGLSDDDIATEWRHERASEVTDDDDATDPKETSTAPTTPTGSTPTTGPPTATPTRPTRNDDRATVA